MTYLIAKTQSVKFGDWEIHIEIWEIRTGGASVLGNAWDKILAWNHDVFHDVIEVHVSHVGTSFQNEIVENQSFVNLSFLNRTRTYCLI